MYHTYHTNTSQKCLELMLRTNNNLVLMQAVVSVSSRKASSMLSISDYSYMSDYTRRYSLYIWAVVPMSFDCDAKKVAQTVDENRPASFG